ncbi:NADP-dependent oxidoreductase domain-containing protein 1 isoform X2 [Phasianus colchicus]|uniref:NADP-dependent oxidoreductase domain-containing protein 1 isoform X2 n=1 Tax=Phasianus colchicus TaxID=9054 RepID=UPI00129DEA1E|nr:NADP-dependent oxidoreductase domain-containing protein 1 isoform X2 [Phasianus colchicus]
MGDIEEVFASFLAAEAVEGEEALLYLTRRRKGLAVNVCAHAIFFCRLLQAFRVSSTGKALLTPLADSHSLKVGIIGGGRLGNQLARALVAVGRAPCSSIRISTRRPESLSDLQKLGLTCFYDNAQLAAWADVLFLCCLPSHVPSVCSAVQPAIRKPCIVYSLITAVPLPRLKQLLCYNAIVRPQYQCPGKEPTKEWGTKGSVTEALQNLAVVQATCPLSSQAKIKVNGKWLVGIFYAALNSSMWQSLPHQEALTLLNDLCFPGHCRICAEQKASCPQFTCESFVSKSFASSMTQEETFPWFDLTAAQLRESPFSQLLEKSESVQNHLALLYQSSFGDWPTEQCVLTSTKTSPTLAIAEPSMMLIQDSSLSTTSLKVFSEIPEETTDYDSKSS